MKIRRMMKGYYDAKMGDSTVPKVPALNLLRVEIPVKRHDFRKELLLNILAHAAIAIMLMFALLPDK